MQDLEWIDGYKRTMTWAFMQIIIHLFSFVFISSCIFPAAPVKVKVFGFFFTMNLYLQVNQKVSLEAWTLKDKLALTSWFAKEVMVPTLDWFS